MTQEELNKIPPTPDPKTFHRLEIDQTLPLMVDGLNRVSMTATLRGIEGGAALVQITFTEPALRQSPFDRRELTS